MTAYALPTPDGVATATSAALSAQTAAQSTGMATTFPVATDLAQGAEAAPAMVAVPASKPGDTMALAMVAPTTPAVANAENATAAVTQVSADASQLAAVAPSPVATKTGRVQDLPISTLAVAAAMESDFDTGEPVGLETLVANRMIVPTERPKTGVIGSTVAAVANVIPDSMKFTKTPTSSRPELDKMIKYYADLNGIPVELVHRVVKRATTPPRAWVMTARPKVCSTPRPTSNTRPNICTAPGWSPKTSTTVRSSSMPAATTTTPSARACLKNSA
jgi:hypothetical protein